MRVPGVVVVSVRVGGEEAPGPGQDTQLLLTAGTRSGVGVHLSSMPVVGQLSWFRRQETGQVLVSLDISSYLQVSGGILNC